MVLRTLRNNRGVTILEFAMVFPMLLMLFAGIVNFGILFFVQHTLQFATREGARLGLVGRTLTDGGGNPMSREASIIKIIQDKASVAVSPGQLQISFFPVAADYSDPANSANTQDAGEPGKYMRVRTRYNFTVPLLSEFVPQARLVLQAQATYRNEMFN